MRNCKKNCDNKQVLINEKNEKIGYLIKFLHKNNSFIISNKEKAQNKLLKNEEHSAEFSLKLSNKNKKRFISNNIIDNNISKSNHKESSSNSNKKINNHSKYKIYKNNYLNKTDNIIPFQNNIHTDEFINKFMGEPKEKNDKQFKWINEL